MAVVIFSEGATIARLDFTHGEIGADGRLEVFSGPMPANPQVPLTTQVKLLEFDFAALAFGPAAISGKSAAAVANGLPISAPGLANGDAVWFQVVQDGGEIVYIGDVSGSLGNGILKMATTTVVSGVNATLVAYTGRLPTGEP